MLKRCWDAVRPFEISPTTPFSTPVTPVSREIWCCCPVSGWLKADLRKLSAWPQRHWHFDANCWVIDSKHATHSTTSPLCLSETDTSALHRTYSPICRCFSFANRARRQLLEEIVGISETFLEGQGQCARALYKLSTICAGRAPQAESDSYKQKAIELLLKLRPDSKSDMEYGESQFSELCPWMLW